MQIALYVIGGVILVMVLVRVCMKKIVVREYETGLLYRNGRFKRCLKPGAHYRPRFSHDAVLLDMRRHIETVPGQEVLTADNVGLKISTVATYELADPEKAFHASMSYIHALYTMTQVTLRQIVAGFKVDEILEKRMDIGKQIFEQVAREAQALGLRVHSVEVKDVMFPGELKNIFAEVVRAQKEGQAALERARGETAALRNLANAAKMMENNPALMNLRILQSIGNAADGKGNTFVLGVPQGLTALDAAKPTARRATRKKTNK